MLLEPLAGQSQLDGSAEPPQQVAPKPQAAQPQAVPPQQVVSQPQPAPQPQPQGAPHVALQPSQVATQTPRRQIPIQRSEASWAALLLLRRQIAAESQVLVDCSKAPYLLAHMLVAE